jgi:hypothetical protein
MVKNESAGRWYERRGFTFLREEPFRMAGSVVSHRIGVKGLALASGIAEAGRGRLAAVYPQAGRAVRLGTLAASLWEAQRGSWPRLQQGCAALEKARIRQIALGDWQVRVQFNPNGSSAPGRLGSPERQPAPLFLCPRSCPRSSRGSSTARST